ncbi:hypothetical protein [Natrononativus amylolyticus]|uniref:hypothetical protein n=1 Tax=Natrononativus amylolyticus TaxID=2963434 RepID=UPI0020CEE844|nr:hypothetical protein [Natrononativus amylolyticus]
MVSRNRILESSDPTVSRRHLLAVTGSGCTAALAGCADLRSRTLRDPAVDDEAHATSHTYYDGDDRVISVSLSDFSRHAADEYRYPIRTNIWHGEGLVLESLEYTFRPDAVRTAPEFYLERPGGYPWEPIQFSRGEDHETTVLAVPDVGFQGQGSVGFELLLAVYDDESFDLHVDLEATFVSEGFVGREYEIEDSMVRTLPGQRALAREE